MDLDPPPTQEWPASYPRLEPPLSHTHSPLSCVSDICWGVAVLSNCARTFLAVDMSLQSFRSADHPQCGKAFLFQSMQCRHVTLQRTFCYFKANPGIETELKPPVRQRPSSCLVVFGSTRFSLQIRTMHCKFWFWILSKISQLSPQGFTKVRCGMS